MDDKAKITELRTALHMVRVAIQAVNAVLAISGRATMHDEVIRLIDDVLEKTRPDPMPNNS
jgi:hypothetical protein